MFRRALLAVSVILVGASPIRGGVDPIAVSPGGEFGQGLATEPCPTFHWSSSDKAEGYELIVYRTKGEDPAPRGAPPGPFPGGRPALRELLPEGVGSWTPSLDRCLKDVLVLSNDRRR